MGVRSGLVARVAAGAAAVVMALAACGDPDPDTSSHQEVVDLDFTLSTVDGDTFDGSSLAGQPAVLWFWASWCVTCAAEAPEVSALADAYAGQAAVVGVAGVAAMNDDEAAMRGFIDRYGVANFPHLVDSDGTVWQRFEITEQSSFVVLDADGAVVLSGVLTPTDVTGSLDQLVS